MITLKSLGIVTIALWITMPIAAIAQHQAPLKEGLVAISVQLQWKTQFQFAGYYAAVEKGFYRDRGLDVRLLSPTENINSVENVLEGHAQFGVSTSDLLLWRAKGKPVVALATIFQHSPFVFLTRADGDIDNIHQLAGKKVMIEDHAAEILAYFQHEGLALDKLQRLPHTYDPSALIKGEVDGISAYATDEPFLLKEAGIKYNIFNPRSGGIDFYGDTLYTTEDYLRDHPQTVRAFVDATKQGWQYALDHPDEIIQLIYRDYSQRHSIAHLRFEAIQTQQLILSDVVEIGYMNPGRWEYIRDTYAELGMIPPNFSLKGFLYQDYSFAILSRNRWILWLSIGLGLALITMAITVVAVARFYRLNQAINREIKEKIAIETELISLEKRYRTLVEHAPFTIIIACIPSGKICYVNPQARCQFELGSKESIDHFTKDFYVHLSDRDYILQTLNTDKSILNHELELKTMNGREFWANVCISVINFDGEPATFVALLDITNRKKLEQKLEMMAMTDELTQTYNRRFFIQKGHEEVSRAKRYGVKFSLMMLDIDFFKRVNDTYGHDTGDRVLKHFTKRLKQNLREMDIIGRLGGEEFGVILPSTEEPQANLLAERLRQNIAASPLAHHGNDLKITVSIGLTSFTPGIFSIDELLKEADIALYQAKETGRDRVIKYDESTMG